MSITQSGTRTTRINSTAGTSCSVPIPTGMTTAHYMVLAVSVAGNKVASITTPAGWTPIGTPTANGTSVTLALWGKFWASGDAAPAPSWSSTNKNTGTIVPFLGVDPLNPIDTTVAAFATGTSTTPASPTGAATTRGAARLHVVARAVGGSSTPDAQMIEATDVSTSTPSPGSLSLDYQLGMAEGADGTRSSTISSGAWVAASAWLRPDAPDSFGLLQVRSTTTSTPNTPDTLAFLNALTPGSTLVVKVASFFPSGAQTSVTYPGGTFTQHAQVHTTNSQTAIYLYQNNQRTTADTVSVNFAAACDAGIVIEEWLGPPTTGALVDQTGTGSSAGSTSVSAATTGATSSGERLALNMVGVGTTQTAYTFDTAYVQRGSQLSNAHMAWAAQSGEFAGGAAETAQVTLSTSSEWTSSLVVLLVATGGGGTQYNFSAQLAVTGSVARHSQARARRSLLVSGSAARHSSTALKKALLVSGSMVRRTRTGARKALLVSASLSRSTNSAFHRSVQLLVTGAVAARKRALLPKRAVSTVALSTKRSTGAKRALQVSGALSVRKRTARTRSIQVSGAVAMSYTKVIKKLLQVAVSVSAGARKAVSSRHTLSITPTPTLRKRVARSSAVSAQVFVSARKRTNKAATVAVSAVAALRKRAGKVAGIAVTATASRSQRTGKKAAVAVSGALSVRKRTSVSKKLAASVFPAMQKQAGMIARLFVVAVTATPRLTKRVLQRRTLLVSAPVSVRKFVTTGARKIRVNGTPTSFRYIGKKILGITVSGTASSRRATRKRAALTVGVSIGAVKRTSRLMRLGVSVGVSMSRTFFYKAALTVSVAAAWSWKRLNMTVGKFPFVIQFVSRVLALSKDARQHTPPAEARTHALPAQERTHTIPPEQRR